MTGLTLPGMIEEPGCRSGIAISPRPVLGPEPIQRRSLQILVTDTAMVRSAPDISTDRKSTRLNSSHVPTSYAVFCLKQDHDDLGALRYLLIRTDGADRD